MINTVAIIALLAPHQLIFNSKLLISLSVKIIEILCSDSFCRYVQFYICNKVDFRITSPNFLASKWQIVLLLIFCKYVFLTILIKTEKRKTECHMLTSVWGRSAEMVANGTILEN